MARKSRTSERRKARSKSSRVRPDGQKKPESDIEAALISPGSSNPISTGPVRTLLRTIRSSSAVRFFFFRENLYLRGIISRDDAAVLFIFTVGIIILTSTLVAVLLGLENAGFTWEEILATLVCGLVSFIVMKLVHDHFPGI